MCVKFIVVNSNDTNYDLNVVLYLCITPSTSTVIRKPQLKNNSSLPNNNRLRKKILILATILATSLNFATDELTTVGMWLKENTHM